jgi:hypothetical protein
MKKSTMVIPALVGQHGLRLISNSKKLDQEIKALQTIYDNEIYSESLSFHSKNHIGEMAFAVNFSYDSNKSFVDCVKETFGNYLASKVLKEQEAKQVNRLKAEKEEIETAWLFAKAEVLQELQNEINEAEKEGTVEVKSVLEIREAFNEKRKIVDKKYQQLLKELDKRIDAELF